MDNFDLRKYFAEGAIEHYEDIILYDEDEDEDSSPGFVKWEDRPL